MTNAILNAWHERYHTPCPDTVASSSVAATDIFTSLLTHRSVRHFLPKDVPSGTISTAIAAAQSAATSSNLQSWSVIAVQDQNRRSRLAELSGQQKHVAEAPLFLVWIADLSRHERIAQRSGHPHVGLDYTESFLVAAIDTALAAQNAVVALEAAGLGTVYIGGLRNHPIEVGRELNLPSKTVALFGLCVGFANHERPAQIKPRLGQKAVLHYEHYDTSEEVQEIERYDDADAAFQTQQSLPARQWSKTVCSRITSPESFNPRDKLKDELKTLGFILK